MATERSGAAIASWSELPDDTEESIVGTQWHQIAIGRLEEMLKVVRDRQQTSWDVAMTMGFRGFSRPDGSTDYAPKPDICVHPRSLPTDVIEVRLADYGPPLLIVEVASTSTWRADVDAKARSYARGGVADYLVVDVDGTLLQEAVQAWHLQSAGGGLLVPWHPEDDSRWHSPLGFSMALDDHLVRVYDASGRRVPTLREAEQQRQIMEARLAQLEQERAQQRSEPG